MQVELFTKDHFIELNKTIESLKDLVSTALAKGGGKKYYNNEELAKSLNVSTKTLQNWRDEGAIEFTQRGSIIIYTQENIDDFLKSHRIRKFKISDNKTRYNT
jgi:hypothetical protein